jgi:hypothetical protein
MVSEPSGFVFRRGSIGELIGYRLIGFATRRCVFASYIVTDQKALAGGSWPAGNVRAYQNVSTKLR